MTLIGGPEGITGARSVVDGVLKVGNDGAEVLNGGKVGCVCRPIPCGDGVATPVA